MLHAARQLPAWLIFDVGQEIRAIRMNLPNYDFSFRPPKVASDAEKYVSEISSALVGVRVNKQPDQFVVIRLHLPTVTIHVKRIGVATDKVLCVETYTDESHTMMFVPIEQCVLSVHIYKEPKEEPRKFMGFSSGR